MGIAPYKIKLSQLNLNKPFKQISVRTANTFKKLGISFSTTQKINTSSVDQNYCDSIIASRDILRNDAELIKREVTNWNLLDEESPSCPIKLPDERTQLHFNSLFYRSGTPFPVNLSSMFVNAEFSNNSCWFSQIIKKHPSLGLISLHLGYAAEEIEKDPINRHAIAKSSELSRDFLFMRVILTLNEFKKNVRSCGYKGPLLLEPLDYQEDNGRSAYKYVTNPGFIRQVLRKSGYDLLLDPAHMIISAMNKKPKEKMSYEEHLLKDGNINRVREIHLSVPKETPSRWADDHRSFSENIESEETQMVLDLFGNILARNFRSKHPQPLIINLESPTKTLPNDLSLIVKYISKMIALI